MRARTKEPSPLLPGSQAPWPAGWQAAPSFAECAGVWGTGMELAGPPHPGPQGCQGPRAQHALQAGVADPAGARLLLQVLRLVEGVLALFPACAQGLDQVHSRAGLEEAPVGRGEPAAQVSAPPACRLPREGQKPGRTGGPHSARDMQVDSVRDPAEALQVTVNRAQTPRCTKVSPSLAPLFAASAHFPGRRGVC